MGKIVTASVSALLILGCFSAFATANTYTDMDSGFKLKSQPSWMEIGGKNFYGLANKPDKKEVYGKRSIRCNREKVFYGGIFK